jgi:predicted hotdog family 3-hydroxylacyl-ACP dehydratase
MTPRRVSRATRAVLPISHRDDAILLDEIAQVSQGRLEARVLVRPGTAFSDGDGNLPAWVGPEIMAQAISALAGQRSLAAYGRPAAIGLLLGVRSYAAPGGDFRCGETLRVEVVESSEDEEGRAVFDCTILRADERLASGALTVYQPLDDTFLEAECARDD